MRYNWKNITLIGMPAAGKSIVGVLLAKRIGYQFIDGDLLIQQQERCLLKETIARKGLEEFKRIEEQVHMDLDCEGAVISPGGSIIYGEKAMAHLKEIGTVVYLKIGYEELERRLGNLKDRGVVLKDGMTLRDLYNERIPIYEKYADITIDEAGKDAGNVVDELRALVEWN